MTIKQFINKKRLRQLEVAREIGTNPTVLNLFLNEWRPIPLKHQKKMAEFLGISLDEVKNNRINTKGEQK